MSSKVKDVQQNQEQEEVEDDLPAELQEEIIRIFKIFATKREQDDELCINSCDLVTVLRDLGQNPTQKDIEEFFKLADTDENGTIDLDEFFVIMKQCANLDPVQELYQAFQVFDRDGDGKITIEELKTTMLKLGECMSDEELQEIFDGADANGDGVLEISEFVTFLQQK